MSLSATTRLLTQLKKTTPDVIFPPGCVRCAEPIDTPDNLCARCWPEMTYISAPFCDICGFPFEYDAGDGFVCATCLRQLPVFARARAVLKYDDASRDMILGYKHSDQTNRAPTFASWMSRAGADLINDCDVICPVPLHHKRLIKRRFNQSALLAGEIAKLTDKPVIHDLITRKRPTISQGGLSAKARLRNVRGVFEVTQTREDPLNGAKVLLIDDVLTTGATVNACSMSLLKGGATKVDVLTFSRVVRASNTAI